MRRNLALVALAAVLAAGCASSDPPGVKTSSVQTDIVFDAAKPAVGPLTPPSGVAADGSGVAPLFPEPFRNKLPDRFKDVRFGLTPQQAASDCPDAPIGAAPSAAAPDNASAPPPAGLYRYKRRGTSKQTIEGTSFASTYSGFEPHLVRDVEKTSATKWTFHEIVPTSDGVDVMTWSVNTDAAQVSQSPPYVGENAIRAGEPGRGIALVSIESYDGNGNQRASFTPSTPVLYMPLPIQQGESFTGLGIDAKTGQSIRVDGETQHRQTVDACGTLLDGWFVKATVSESQSNGASYTHADEYVFSTDLGGMLLSRRTVGTVQTANGSIDSDLTVSVGQTSPSPDPGSAK
jgi:hypothetical protein